MLQMLGSAPAAAPSSSAAGSAAVLLPLPLMLPPRAPPRAASLRRRPEFIQDAQPVPQSFTRTLRRSLRVSATCRRGAAAYGVAFQCILEARTHGCLLYLRRYT